MSFSAGVKDELTGIPMVNACCRLPELAGLTLSAGSMHLVGGGIAVEFTTESPAIARRVYQLIKSHYGVSPRIEQHERRRLNRNISYRVILQDSKIAQRLLAEVGVTGDGDISPCISPEFVRLSCCEGAFIRGLFLGCGSMSDPGKGYHLELVLQDEQLAGSVVALLVGLDISAHVVSRNGRQVVYIKEADHVSDFLVRAGAHTSMLRFEGVRVEKGVRNSVNRVVNCDSANVEKTVNASGRQMDSIRLIAGHEGLAKLPQGLREAAQARLENPDATLERLAELMGGISKSGLNHRFHRIEEYAENLRLREEMRDGF